MLVKGFSYPAVKIDAAMRHVIRFSYNAVLFCCCYGFDIFIGSFFVSALLKQNVHEKGISIVPECVHKKNQLNNCAVYINLFVEVDGYFFLF